jgi:hypothetical protein
MITDFIAGCLWVAIDNLTEYAGEPVRRAAYMAWAQRQLYMVWQ